MRNLRMGILMVKKNNIFVQFVFFVVFLILSDLSLASLHEAGSTPGSFSVSGGTASYSVPIKVPPGMAGMAPSLSLIYSSSSGNGLLGMGWSLSTTSMISRCPATKAKDGINDPVDYDNNDNFCLDGQRLVPITDGSCNYCSREYRTETDSFYKIESYGAIDDPDYFKVYTNSGQSKYYGASVDSRIEAQGKTQATLWAINKVEDVSGNYLTYSYYEDNANGYSRISKIDYTGNLQAGLVPSSSIVFQYETRQDKIAGYSSGAKTSILERLSSIKSYVSNNVFVREYRLTYDASSATNVSRLTGIEECSATTCKLATTFAYSNANLGSINTTSGGGHGLGDAGWLMIDLFGDGKQVYYTHSKNGNHYATRVNKDGTVRNWTWTGGHGLGDAGWQMVDLFGDGHPVYYTHSKNGTHYATRLNENGTLQNWTWTGGHGLGDAGWKMVDLFGDGKQVYYTHSSNGTHYATRLNEDGTRQNWTWTGGHGLGNAGWQMVDLFGHGRAIYYTHSSNGTHYATRLNEDGTRQNWTWTGGHGLGDAGWQMVNLFGDGKQVYYTHSKNGTHYATRLNEDGTRQNWTWTGGHGLGDAGWQMANIFGDGKQVYYTHSSNGNHYATRLNEDGSRQNWTWTGGHGLGNAGWRLADLFGEGRPVYYTHSSNGTHYSTRFLSDTPDVMTTVDAGASGKLNIQYKYLTDNTVYTKYATANKAAGYIDVQPATQVVSSYTADDGAGGLATYQYTYEGLISHKFGYGSMGFYREIMTDVRTGIKSYVVNLQDYPRNGQQYYSYTTLGNVTLNYSVNYWRSIKTHVNKVNVLQMYQTYSYSRELDNTLVKRTLTSNVYDDFNNPTQITINTYDGYVKTTNNTYNPPDVNSWVVNRLASSSVTNVTPTGTAPARTSAFEYDYGTGLLTKEIIEPNNPDLYKETEYTYDVYGNKASITVRGNVAASYPFAQHVTSSRYIPGTEGTLYPQIETINAEGHVEVKTYDARWGAVIALVGPNGLSTRWTYDSLGRQIRETRADGTFTTRAYNLCEANCLYAAPISVTVQDFGSNNVAASPPSTTYYDELGREKLTTSIGYDGRAVCKETHFDRFGRVAQTSVPYFANSPQSCAYGSTTHAHTDIFYDVLGRAIKKVDPDGTITRSEYHGLTTITINDKGNSTTQVKNSQDQLVQVTDATFHSNLYEYDPYGNMVKVTDAAGNVVTMDYDLAGHKIAMDDPNMGHWQYEYNALGELRKQSDARGKVTTMDYDRLGRMVTKQMPEGLATWVYDAPNALGKLALVKLSGPEGYQRQVTYDQYIRPVLVRTSYKGNVFDISTVYDNTYGRVAYTNYPDLGAQPFKVKNVYKNMGYLQEVRDGVSNALYWRLESVNARGQTIMESYGNGVVQIRDYNDLNGHIKSIQTGASNNIQNLAYQYDNLGNLTQRQDLRQNLVEKSNYDPLNRLTGVTIQAGSLAIAKSYVYDSVGNISFKSDVGSYLYGQTGAGPNQVTTAGSKTYSYDANGNQISGDGRSISYTSFNKPSLIIKGSTNSAYSYDADNERIEKVSVSGGKTTSSVYLGSVFERTVNYTGVVSHKFYIGAGGSTVMVTHRSNQANDTRYLHRDHIGSIDAVTDENGNIVELNSFGAWGERRAANWVNPISSTYLSVTTRGFTGHEMEEDLGLINMKARMYDPVLGRFLQADTVIQFANSTQGFNRYTYAANNPLSYADPTGHSLLGDIVDSIVGAVTDITQAIIDVHKAIFEAVNNELKRFFLRYAWARQLGSIAAAYFGGPVGAALFQGYLTHISGGSWSDVGKAMAISFVSSMAFNAIGDGLQSGAINGPEATLLHGLVGGATAEAQGGSFQDGFVGAAVGKMVTLGSSSMGIKGGTGQMIMSIMAGGLSAKAGGGKFSDGAKTAAMGYLFNSAMHASTSSGKFSIKDFAIGVLDVVGKIWNLPNTIIGVTVGLIGHAIGEVGYLLGLTTNNPSIGFGHNAIEFKNNPLMPSNGAITIGNAIIYGSGAYGAAPHEMIHTYQGEVLGPLYLPANIIGMTVSVMSYPIQSLRGPDAFHGKLNIMETNPSTGQLWQ